MNPIAVAEYNGNFSLDVNGNVYRVPEPVEIYNIDNLSQTAIIIRNNGIPTLVHLKQLDNIKYLPE